MLWILYQHVSATAALWCRNWVLIFHVQENLRINMQFLGLALASECFCLYNWFPGCIDLFWIVVPFSLAVFLMLSLRLVLGRLGCLGLRWLELTGHFWTLECFLNSVGTSPSLFLVIWFKWTKSSWVASSTGFYMLRTSPNWIFFWHLFISANGNICGWGQADPSWPRTGNALGV